MPTHTDHYTNVLRFWRSVETFSFPDLGRSRSDSIETVLSPGDPLPWETRTAEPPAQPEYESPTNPPGPFTPAPGNDRPFPPAPDNGHPLPPRAENVRPFPPPPEGRRWKHTLYFHIVQKEAVTAELARLTASAEYREPVSGQTCFSVLVVNQDGIPGARAYAPAAFVYAIKLIREKHDPEELTELLKEAQDTWQPRFGIKPEEEPIPLTWPMLKNELAYLRRITANTMPANPAILCISELTTNGSHLDAPFLNSYHIQDLDTLIRHPRGLGLPLQRFLTPEIDMSKRKDLLDPAVLINYVHPKYLPAGRWPANPAQGLYSAQLAALNITCTNFDADAPASGSKQDEPVHGSPLLGINGPPGTGKTTLLREIIADIIVGRAKNLLNAHVESLFSASRTSITEHAGYYQVDSAVFSGHGIVVASNNNTAIENISRELPQLQSIDIDAFPNAEYFSMPATAIHGTISWGLLSAVLGRSANRAAFVDKFWFHRGDSFNKHLRDLYDDADSATANFVAVAQELRELLDEYERFQKLAAAYHDAVLNSKVKGEAHQPPATQPLTHDPPAAGPLTHDPLTAARTQLITEYELHPDNLPGPDFTSLSTETLHRMMPYSSEKVNTLRSNIFLRSLELHEWAIRANPRQFQTNLSSFVDLISHKHREKFDENIAAILWDTFFFCIPVVSVTLASFTRQFSRMGTGSIGWLLVDEAGQATLPSVCGALWRSKRSVLIGDTLQIPPVVTIPEGLGRLLQRQYKVSDDTWSPIHESAQSLADRATAVGAWLKVPGTGQTHETGQPIEKREPRARPAGKHTAAAQPAWTGIPLRAHRRCDEPMFSIANTIAYNGQMVRVSRGIPTGSTSSPHTNTTSPLTSAPPSTWIDVQGFINDGHTITEELDAVEQLLQVLANYPGKIFIISPFRIIAEACHQRFTTGDKIQCGTIHTFQGKEAETVLLVLGTLPASKQARHWVAATPNILNVAITRARHRLYVIGNRRIWSAHRYF
ncbi:MAG TPA: AAA domain-containing protein, partial [Puia sp.]|nr:AAA domain-containing protein [Puia sp.]